MEGLFLEILNMSVNASWLIIAVILLRLFMKKSPKGLRYVLWALVAIRLLCPISLESSLSLIPNQETLQEKIKHQEVIKVEQQQSVTVGTGAGGDNGVVIHDDIIDGGTGGVEGTISDTTTENNYDTIYEIENGKVPENDFVEQSSSQTNTTIKEDSYTVASLSQILSWFWIMGGLFLLTYAIVSYVKLRQKVSVAIPVKENVWVCDEIQTPFILGLINPRIYVPSFITEEQMPYIEAHENEHLKYHDNWWKPLGFLILAIHWFNPLVWVAYVLMCRDIEYACDERVIKGMDNSEKKRYTESLLHCSSPRYMISACPVAFGEVGIKERIKSVVNYKKPSTWIVGIGVLACIVIAICFMTNQVGESAALNNTEATEDTETSEEIVTENSDTIYTPFPENLVFFETTADLNHDGIEDKLQSILIYTPPTGSSAKIDLNAQLSSSANSACVKIFLGKEDGTFEEKAACTTNIVSMSHSANGEYILTEKDGKAYLIYSNMYEMQGIAEYRYNVMYIRGEELVSYTQDSIEFAVDPFLKERWNTMPHREDVIPEFRSGLEPWIENGMLLVALDIENEVLYSEEGNLVSPSAYFDQVWARNEDEILAEYNAILGEEWQQLIYQEEGDDRSIAWIQRQLQSDFSEWYTRYDGSKLQRIDNEAIYSTYGNSLSINNDIIYYDADTGESVQQVLYKMIEAMIVTRMEPVENRSYTITDYVILDSPVIQIADNMWFITYLNGYYKYDGTDMGTFEERYEYESEFAVDGCLPFLRQGSDGNFWFILIEEDGVYRLQRYQDMNPSTTYSLD